MVTAEIVGTGTPERVWEPWLHEQAWPDLDIAPCRGRRIVVLAAHPDDEVLGVGGLMAALSAMSLPIVLVWATDGEASHPGSTSTTPEQLRWVRRDESREALARLGIDPVASYRLTLPDGELRWCTSTLRKEAEAIVRPDDVVIAPWIRDGHPDHEAVGLVASELGAVRWQYPIWMWHWASPADAAVPWHRLRRLEVGDQPLKWHAITAFTSQIEPLGLDRGDEAILPPPVLARFARRFEWIFV